MEMFMISHCDKWKSYDSMRLIGVVSKGNLRNALQKIKKECRYTDEDMETYIYIDSIALNDLNL